METPFAYIAVALLGLVLGSFAGATVWRLRARQLVEDKAAGEDYDKKELTRLKPLTKGAFSQKDRSRCLGCRHELALRDLLPLVSWLSSGGKCRYCRQPIGWFEPAIELGTAALFVLFYHYWLGTYGLNLPLQLVLWLPVLVLLVILFAYDYRWYLLPDRIMFPLIAVAAVLAVGHIAMHTDVLAALFSTLGAVLMLGGLYLVLWLVSRGAWVGFGDVKLGLALGLLLADWRLAFLTLLMANLIGTLIVLPGLLTKRLSRGTHVPFGPLLITGFFISLLWGEKIIAWYVHTTIMLVL